MLNVYKITATSIAVQATAGGQITVVGDVQGAQTGISADVGQVTVDGNVTVTGAAGKAWLICTLLCTLLMRLPNVS